MKKNDIDLLMNGFGGELGIDNLQMDADNCCCLSFDNTVLNMEFDEEQNRLLLYSNVGDIPEHEQAEFYQMLLDANLFWKGTGGGTLSIDKKAESVILISACNTNHLSLESFKSSIASFLDAAETWTNAIGNFEAVPQKSNHSYLNLNR
ncbi:type III secretion system chaperone [Vibrio marisflavi]|uniref:Uncharacterized protein n=1 Tax=Vibrio marisflavi CECT 7928 TaxID=634439 RepID=A0ABM8ZYG5_9VIBR|nr:type III secretion system chaperone [Vibrio marisflavi]CAH0535973.1 hypothetical protein VMF7928_00078 [Vibrio marisflavi CECT 7928]